MLRIDALAITANMIDMHSTGNETLEEPETDPMSNLVPVAAISGRCSRPLPDPTTAAFILRDPVLDVLTPSGIVA
jgi:hypothetical protein